MILPAIVVLIAACLFMIFYVNLVAEYLVNKSKLIRDIAILKREGIAPHELILCGLRGEIIVYFIEQWYDLLFFNLCVHYHRSPSRTRFRTRRSVKLDWRKEGF